MSTDGITCQNTITYGPETLKKLEQSQSAQRVLSMSDDERKAIEMALRMLATQLKRCTVTGVYYLPISAGFACNAEQARAIETALEKIAQY